MRWASSQRSLVWWKPAMRGKHRSERVEAPCVRAHGPLLPWLGSAANTSAQRPHPSTNAFGNQSISINNGTRHKRTKAWKNRRARTNSTLHQSPSSLAALSWHLQHQPRILQHPEGSNAVARVCGGAMSPELVTFEQLEITLKTRPNHFSHPLCALIFALGIPDSDGHLFRRYFLRRYRRHLLHIVCVGCESWPSWSLSSPLPGQPSEIEHEASLWRQVWNRRNVRNG